jgi:cyclase
MALPPRSAKSVDLIAQPGYNPAVFSERPKREGESMRIAQIAPDVLAFLDTDGGPNAGLVRTSEGIVVVDTTISPPDMQERLDAAGTSASEARLVINTHFHSDHTWGNQLFTCPILAHQVCREEMEARLAGDWPPEEITACTEERGKIEPAWAEDMRRKWADLCITLPTETFEERRKAEIGGVRIEVIHFDAHTPDSSVVWLPEAKVLFAGDLIFEGRYPFLYDADVPALIGALKRLPDFAQVVVPGHGALCGKTEIDGLVSYLEETWTRAADHVAEGRSEDEAVTDPDYPRYAERGAERYHEANIRLMYAQLKRQAANF